MSENTMVFSMPNVTSADGVVSIGYHTSEIGFMNQSDLFVEIRLNGKFIIKIGHGQVEAHAYNVFAGDYTSFEIITGSATLSVYALG